MPTGYTAGVEDGTVTEFSEFAMNCARAFGALIHMRDDSNSTEIRPCEPTTYHLEALDRARMKLAEIRRMSIDEVHAAAERAHLDAVKSEAMYQQRREADNQRHDAMLAKVRAWIPPTPDHAELKRFMENQLSISKHDVRPSIVPERPSTADWLAKQIASAEYDITYHRKKHEEEVKRCNERNEWVQQLRRSLTDQHEPATR